ncbi:uncharacterized protein LOC121609712 [Chelmon rostratus]|uniref:uncharacterized protein LOC121609712 n=1 Tax=Chelmon rostratus TaxID=109905 RepID=UPI001BE99094|nr:uncharacterized protein LOC121609712 [Chelmon rostratus]
MNSYSPPVTSNNSTSHQEQSQIIRSLQNNPHIIIKPADKGSKIVIMDKQQYALEARRQLSNMTYYKPIQSSLQHTTQTRIRTITQDLYHKKYISAKQRNFLFGPDDPRERRFYLLPKIHKEPQTWTVPFKIPPGRPIVSDCNSVTYNISQYIDSFLGPLSVRHPSYLKDTYHFIEKIRPLVLPSNAILFTIDIDSLYTNIDTRMGLQTIRTIFNRYPDRNRPDDDILQLLEICLTCNDFTFDNQYYLQVHGTAMGHRYAPSYANLYMSEWERSALQKCPLQPLFYLRFLDDIIGAWEHGEEKFLQFIQILNHHHPSIKVKHSLDAKQINFLDTTVYFHNVNEQNKKLLTRVYFKPTDTHALLHKTSYHPKHTFKGIVKSQIIRFHRISSSPEDLENAISTLFTSLRRRGYSRRFLRSIKSSTLASLRTETGVINRNNSLQNGDSPLQDGDSCAGAIVPLITTFSNRYTGLHNTLKNNFQRFLTDHPILKEYRVISALRKNKNLRDALVKASFGKDKNKNKPQNLWKFKHTKFLYNPHSGRGTSVNGYFSIKEKNVVYCLQCTQCNLLYIGETVNTIQARLKQHLYNIREGRLQTPLVNHFRSHSTQGMTVMGLEACATWTGGQRRWRERCWIDRLKTRIPQGLNVT